MRLVAAAVALLIVLAALPASAEPATIGVVGCSNTAQHAQIYNLASDQDTLTDPGGVLGGGTPKAWTGERGVQKYWPSYDSLRPADGYSAVWVQICMREVDHGGVFDQREMDVVSDLVAMIRDRDPQASIFMSPLNEYTTDSCVSVGGINGQQVTAATAAWATANLGVLPGPVTGALTPEMTSDGCHIGSEGEPLIGSQMVAFFDGQPPSTTSTTVTTIPGTTTTTTVPGSTTTTSTTVTTIPGTTTTTAVPGSTTTTTTPARDRKCEQFPDDPRCEPRA